MSQEKEKVMPKALIYDGEFNPSFPRSIELYYTKEIGFLYNILKKFDLTKNKWHVTGFMMNYKPKETITFLLKQLRKEFPNIGIKRGYSYKWDKEDYLLSAGGAEEIYIIFETDSDEAEFIVRNHRILDSIKANITSLGRTQ
jgi:hypothetical protein